MIATDKAWSGRKSRSRKRQAFPGGEVLGFGLGQWLMFREGCFADLASLTSRRTVITRVLTIRPLDVVVMVARFFDYLANRRMAYSICS
jgi:hypothetical protein